MSLHSEPTVDVLGILSLIFTAFEVDIVLQGWHEPQLEMV